jgi:hypothetical protein
VFDFYFDNNELSIPPGSYDTAKELVTMALTCDLFRIKGAYYHLGEDSWHGRAQLEEQIRYDLSLQEKLRSGISDQIAKGRRREESRPEPRRLVRSKN